MRITNSLSLKRGWRKAAVAAVALSSASVVALNALAPVNAAGNLGILTDNTTAQGDWSFTQDLPEGGTVRTYNMGTFAYVLPNSTGDYEYEVGGTLTNQPSLDEKGGKGFGDGGYTGEQAGYSVHGPTEAQEARVPLLPGGTTRRATACFGSSVTVNLPLPAGDYRLAVYLLDYDRNGRVQTTIATDNGANTVATTVNDAKEGVYLLYNVHTNGTAPVSVTSIIDAGPNAVLSGLFVDPLGAPTTGLTFAGFDTTTKGNWIGAKGATGYMLCGANGTTGAVEPWSPSKDISSGLGGYTVSGSVYAWGNAFPNVVATSPAFAYAWSDWQPQETGDMRAATFWKYNSTTGGATIPGDRRATAWDSGDDILPTYNGGARPLVVDVHTPSNSTSAYCGFRVSFYWLDIDGNRTQTYTLADVTGGANNVIQTRTLSNFSQGLHTRYDIPSNRDLRLTVTKVAGVNAVLSGIFWDENPCVPGGVQGEDPATDAPRTPGYWGNWPNKYTPAQFDALLASVRAAGPVFATVTTEQANTILRMSAKNMTDKLKQHYLALLLNRADGKLRGAAKLDLTKVAGAPQLFGGNTITVTQYQSIVNNKFGSASSPWSTWSRKQQEIAKAVADATNNFGHGSNEDVGIIVG